MGTGASRRACGPNPVRVAVLTGILATLGGVLDARPARVIAVDAPGPALLTPLRLTPAPEDADAGVIATVIEGRVRTATGVPVAGALIALTATEAPDTPATLVAIARSDAAGRYRFAGLALAAHELGASAPGFAPGGARVAMPPLTDPAHRCDIVLGPPDANSASEVSGTVRDHRGRARPGALVVAERPGQPAVVGFADTHGQYRMVLGRGAHTVIARAPGQLAARQHRELTGAGRIDFALAPAARIRGRVLVPAPGKTALVRVARIDAQPGADDEREVRSAGDGTFVLDDLAPGRYAVFARAGADAGAAGRPLAVAHGDDAVVTVTLGRAHTVAGQVRDGRGAPVGAAAVSLVPIASERGGLAIARAATATGRDGRFVFAGVLPGRYRLKATSVGHLPSASELAIAGDVDGLALALPPAGVLTGTVRDANGRPVAGAVVHGLWHPAEARDGASRRPLASRTLARTAADGRFTLAGLPAGRTRLVVAHGELGVRELTVEGGRREVTVRFASPIAMRGGVRWHDDAPVDGARVRFVAQTLEGLGPAFEATATTASDGRYRLFPLQPGTGRLFAERPRDAAARWLPGAPGRAGQQRMLYLAGAQERSEADLVLLRDDLTVTGRVLGPAGAPVAGATVTAWLGAGAREPARAARTDATGRYVLADLPAGEYELRASHPLHPTGRRPGVIAGADGIDVALPAGATLRGHFVVAADGAAGPVEVQVVPALTAGTTSPGTPSPRNERWIFAGTDAGFAVGPLAPGEYHLIARALGGATAHLAGVTITAGGLRADVVLTLTDPPAALARR